MYWTAWSTLAALLLYIWTIFNVGRARGKFGIAAPAMEGPVEFQSVLRVQTNTLEQLVLHLPAMWLCAVALDDEWAAIAGAVWVVGRIIYALGYYKDPKRRGTGFTIGLLATVTLMVGAASGLIQS
jgi:glutathione S-transferase